MAGVLNGIAAILLAAGSFLTGLGGIIGVIVMIRRTSPREREDATRQGAEKVAEQAAEQVLNPPLPPIVAEADALTKIRDARERRDQA